jgi:hypothetical protein
LTPDDTHPDLWSGRAEGARESHEAGIARAADDIVGIHPLPGRADDIHDHPAPPARHMGVDAAGDVDEAEHLQVPCPPPGHVVDLVEGSRRIRAGIIDQDVEVRAGVGQRHLIGAAGEVADADFHREPLMRRAQRRGDRLKRRLASAGEHQRAAFFGQHFRDGPADALARPRDQGAFAAQAKVHDAPP